MSLQRQVPFPQAGTRVYIAELDGLQGRPDLVVGDIRAIPDGVDHQILASALVSPTKAFILSLLRYGACRRLAFLANVTALPNRSLGRHLGQLQEAGIVRVDTNCTVSLAVPLSWSMAHIVAYEGKLSNWRRALHQAIGYRSFSQSVRIVMPAKGAKHAHQLAGVFKNTGIGLIAMDDDGNPRIEIRSRNRRPASRRLYLMAVGAILARLNERTALQPCIDSEPIHCI